MRYEEWYKILKVNEQRARCDAARRVSLPLFSLSHEGDASSDFSLIFLFVFLFCFERLFAFSILFFFCDINL